MEFSHLVVILCNKDDFHVMNDNAFSVMKMDIKRTGYEVYISQIVMHEKPYRFGSTAQDRQFRCH